MKDIYSILAQFGITIPEDKKSEFIKLLDENYKTVKEVERLNTKLQTTEASLKTANDTISQRDADLADVKSKLEKANTDAEALKGVQTQLTDLQTKYEQEKTALQEQLTKQQYESAVKEATRDLKFTSNSAKKAFIADLTAKELKLENGVLLGFDDYVKQYKEQDSGAFVVEDPNPTPNPTPNPSFVNKTNPAPAPNPNPFQFSFNGVRPHEIKK